MPEFTYEVLEKFGVLSESPTGWTKEFRLMSWNNRAPRYDLREWSPGDTKASRGITLSLKEARALQEILIETDLPELEDEGEGGGERERAVPEAHLGESAKTGLRQEGARKKVG